jgi:hypothetical protein
MAKTGTSTATGTGRKKQNVFADDEDQQPNSAYNKAVEAAKNAATPIAEGTRDDASVVTSTTVPTTVASAAVTQKDQELPLSESLPARKPENQKADRAGAGYTKATHRIHDDAFQALEDMKLDC